MKARIRYNTLPFHTIPDTACSLEFATTVQYYYGYKAYMTTQILYTITMQFLNIAAMIISAQVWYGMVFYCMAWCGVVLCKKP